MKLIDEENLKPFFKLFNCIKLWKKFGVVAMLKSEENMSPELSGLRGGLGTECEALVFVLFSCMNARLPG